MPELARRTATAVPLAVLALAAVIGAPSRSSAAPAPSYQGTAAASGVQVRVQVPALSGLTDVPVDGGGPTAQAASGSLGTSTGYAAFPDPGQFVVSVPGLLAGLTAGQVPSLPAYPFSVQSDAVTAPERSLGEGPYRLRATSDEGRATATALAGFELTGLGNAALVRSTATVGPSGDGAAATSTVEVEGVTIGPITLAGIRATAEMAVDAGGTVRRRSSLHLDGVEVAGLRIGLSDRGLELAGSASPLPLEQLLGPVLAPLGIGVRVTAAQDLSDTVIAPALELTVPVPAIDVPGVATVSATVTLRIGAASASLAGAAASPEAAPTTVGAVAVDEPIPPSAGPVAFAPVGSTIPRREVPPPTAPIAHRAGLVVQWDTGSLYLVLVGGALLLPVAGEAIRRKGVSR